MIKKQDRGFTVHLKIDFVHDLEGDQEIAKGNSHPGSFWQASVSEIKDSENRVLNMQTAFAWEALIKSGGLNKLLKECVILLPRFLDTNGLPNK